MLKICLIKENIYYIRTNITKTFYSPKYKIKINACFGRGFTEITENRKRNFF